MINVWNNFYTSGMSFDESELELKARYQVVNIILLLSILGLLFGILGNIIRGIDGYILIEFILILSGFIMIYLIRKSKRFFNPVMEILSFEYSIFFVFLVLFSPIEDMKHVWLFTYPLIILNLQTPQKSKYWLSFVVFLLIFANFQPFFKISISSYQTIYIIFVLVLVSLITYFYQRKMMDAREVIMQQRVVLEKRYNELLKKDKMLSTQSKQAVMGEMMSMIAHQWRQPLSTVTLLISNLQFGKMLGNEISSQKLDSTLNEISSTLVYLSETINDFQTYFHPNKIKSKVEIHEVLKKAVNFAKPRANRNNIEMLINKETDIESVTYENELIKIILNLINNAIDALINKDTQNSKITISAKNVDDMIYIYVKDTGEGIALEHIDKVFEPYFSTKGKNGTGLGLYMSQIIAQKQFDGEISVSSSDVGATFLVKIKKDVNF